MNDPDPQQRQPSPELRDLDKPVGMATWLKVVLWLLGLFVGLPLLGLLLLAGYCALGAR